MYSDPSKESLHSTVENKSEYKKQVFPSATRNQEPILQVLKKYLNAPNKLGQTPLFLEIASGSGQHTAHFAPNFPDIIFQPTEIDFDLLGSISSYAQSCPTKNIRNPIYLDISEKIKFEPNSIDYIYNANMMHISPYESTIGLFQNAAICLRDEGLLITYGPYSINGVLTPESNVNFNAYLKSMNEKYGVRDINDLNKLASKGNIKLIEKIAMPSNNFTLIWQKKT